MPLLIVVNYTSLVICGQSHQAHASDTLVRAMEQETIGRLKQILEGTMPACTDDDLAVEKTDPGVTFNISGDNHGAVTIDRSINVTLHPIFNFFNSVTSEDKQD